MTRKRRGLVTLVVFLSTAPAYAYRPFDSTDADIAGPGEVEIEFGPVGYLNEDGDDSLVTPAIVLNAGIHPRLELVVEGKGLAPLDRDASERRYQIVDTGLTAKGLLRRGSLQGESGPSVAVEAGVLLPTLHDEGGVGGEAIGIVSHRFRHLTAHLDGEVAYTRSETWELGLGLILEGPAWRGVRPVVEATVARELDEANLASGLAGVIWEARPGLSFDLAFRYAREDGTDTREVRAGLTWTFDAMGREMP